MITAQAVCHGLGTNSPWQGGEAAHNDEVGQDVQRGYAGCHGERGGVHRFPQRRVDGDSEGRTKRGFREVRQVALGQAIDVSMARRNCLTNFAKAGGYGGDLPVSRCEDGRRDRQGEALRAAGDMERHQGGDDDRAGGVRPSGARGESAGGSRQEGRRSERKGGCGHGEGSARLMQTLKRAKSRTARNHHYGSNERECSDRLRNGS